MASEQRRLGLALVPGAWIEADHLAAGDQIHPFRIDHVLDHHHLALGDLRHAMVGDHDDVGAVQHTGLAQAIE